MTPIYGGLTVLWPMWRTGRKTPDGSYREASMGPTSVKRKLAVILAADYSENRR